VILPPLVYTAAEFAAGFPGTLSLRPETVTATVVDIARSLTLTADRFDIEPEITAKVFKRNLRVYEIPITYHGRSYDEGKKITWRDGFSAMWALVRFRFSD
jgi:hypothetical protein